jgi:hypothetical protein
MRQRQLSPPPQQQQQQKTHKLLQSSTVQVFKPGYIAHARQCMLLLLLECVLVIAGNAHKCATHTAEMLLRCNLQVRIHRARIKQAATCC